MKFRKIITTVVLGLMTSSALIAQDMTSPQENNVLSGQSENEWYYVNYDFDGLWFQLPNGMEITKGSEFRAVAPGFGVNMMKINQPSNIKISKELCKRTCDSLHLPRNSVRNVSFKGVKGVMAEGLIEGKKVTLIVLPFDEHQVQIVLMSDAFHTEWGNHFMKTLKR